MSADDKKQRAGEAALDYLADGMIIGLGTGSTAAHFVRALGRLVADGLNVTGVPTSEATDALARDVGVPLADPNDVEEIDLTVDGADEADHQLRLIKGGGGALLREKIIASASAKMIVVADDTKLVRTLGAYPLPVEVTPFGFAMSARRVAAALQDAGVAAPEIRVRGGEATPFVSDGGNYILDCACGVIEHPDDVAAALSDLPGVVEHGLFLNLASLFIVGCDDGVEILTAS